MRRGRDSNPRSPLEAQHISSVLHSTALAPLQLGQYTWNMEKIKIEHHTLSGGAWIAAWLFTIGFLKLTFWQGVLAIIIWPYYIGTTIAIVR